MIRWYVDNQRSHSGRRPQGNSCQLADKGGRAAWPDRRPVRAGGAPTARPRIGAQAAVGAAPQELLDDRRARRPGHPGQPAAPAEPGGLGRARRPRDIRDYLLEHLADPAALLVVDETGDLKKGSHTVGVQRQYTGTAGKVDNAQVAVYLAYATTAGHGVIDRELYLPQGWLADPARCRAAGVPTQVEFQTKPELARRRLERALDAGVPAGWVTADEVYGGSAALRGWLETRQLPYVLAVRCTEPLSPASGPPHPTLAARLAERIPPARWLLGDPGHAGVRVPGGGCGHPARPASRAPGAIQLTCNEITTCSPRWSWWRRRQQARARARACHYRRQAAQQP